MHRFTIVLKQSVTEEARIAAAHYGISIAELFRRLLRSHLHDRVDAPKSPEAAQRIRALGPPAPVVARLNAELEALRAPRALRRRRK